MRSNFSEKSSAISTRNVGLVRSEGLEPPRCYSLPPQGSASTNSATSAFVVPARDFRRTGSAARDVTNRGWGDKARKPAERLPGARRFRQHSLDFDGDPVAIDQHHAAGNREI